MSSPKKEGGFFGSLGRSIKRLFGLGDAAEDDFVEERRAAKRMKIKIPVQLEGASRTHEGRTHDLSPIGIFVRTEAAPATGVRMTLLFEGVGKDARVVMVVGRVIRTTEKPVKGLGFQFDRQATGPDDWTRFREMVFHYRRHPPLLEEIGRGIRETKCESCGWVGRVAGQTDRCPTCGKKSLKDFEGYED